MTITDRDRRILLFIVPVVAAVAFWFLLLGPKREAASEAGKRLERAEQKRDQASGRLAQARTAKASYTQDYTAVVRLGKAVPPGVDMASVMVQLQTAAKGTGIDFAKIQAEPRLFAPASGSAGGAAAAKGGSSSSGGSSGSAASAAASSSGAAAAGTGVPAPGGTAAPGGTPAQSAPGRPVEKAGETAVTASARSGAAGAQGSSGGGTAQGGSGASTAAGGAAATTGPKDSGVPGLDAIPLQITFKGDFSGLADLFHRMKRFVLVSGDGMVVRGRLLEITALKFDGKHFPRIKADLRAKVYLAPRAEGVTGGATPTGPPGAQQVSTPSAPSGASNPAPPSAVATR